MSNGVSIHYGDVAPEAKENFYPLASESKYNTLGQLQQYNISTPNYANPCEVYQTVLDGKATAFPSSTTPSGVGLYSEQLSGADGTFTTPITLTVESVGQYSSQGLTLTFDTYNQIYATRIKIQWLRITDITEVLAEEEFHPTSAMYFCKKQVENYNKVIITFYSINMPNNRLKLRVLDYGYGTIFYGNELRDIRITQEVDPISTELSINTANFTLDSKSETIYSFQAKQPLSIYYNGKLKATCFVKESTRKAKFLWSIKSEDYIGMMDKVPYYGGMYDGADAYGLMVDIFSTAKVPYNIDETLKGVKLYGHIPITTCRDALMQVAFATMRVVDTSESESVMVYRLSNETKQTIPLDRIMQGQKFKDEETVTGVEIMAYSYYPIEEVIELYSSEKSGIGANIVVKFSEPVHTLTITNGTILLSGANYAVINADAGCVLNGCQYEVTEQLHRKNNPVVLASELENVLTIDGATLVSSHNVGELLENSYTWLTRVNTTDLKIVEGKHVEYGRRIKYGQRKYGTFKWGEKHPNVVTYDEPVSMGDMITAETEYLGYVTGRIVKQTYNLSGGIVIKEAVLR